jgi:hypothetical protein
MRRNSITETLLTWTWIGIKSALLSIIMSVSVNEPDAREPIIYFGDILFGIIFLFAMNVDE